MSQAKSAFNNKSDQITFKEDFIVNSNLLKDGAFNVNDKIYKKFQQLLISQTIENDANDLAIKASLFSNNNNANNINFKTDKSNVDLDDEIFDSWIPFINDFVENDSFSTILNHLEQDSNNLIENNDILTDNPTFLKQINSCFSQLSDVQNDINQLNLSSSLNNLETQLNAEISKMIKLKQMNNQLSLNEYKLTACNKYIEGLLKILELFNRCNELINNSKDFIAALNNLKTLEIYFNKFISNTNKFDFMKLFQYRIVDFKEKIKTEIFLQLKESLNIKLMSKFITFGENYFSLYADSYLNNWKQYLNKNVQLKKLNSTTDDVDLKFNSDMERLMRSNFVDGDVRKVEVDLNKLEDWYNLIPFFDAIQVFKLFDEYDNSHSVSSNASELDQLLLECQKIFKAFKNEIIKPISMDNEFESSDDQERVFDNLESFKNFIFKIIGLQKFESFINLQTDSVFSEALNIHEFWKQFCKLFTTQVAYFIEDHSHGGNSDFYQQINDSLAILIVCFKENNIEHEKLLELQFKNFAKYTQKEFKTFDVSFQNLLNDDDFMPLNLDEKKLFNKILKLCWFKKEDILEFNESKTEVSDEEFLICLPFSPLYPMTCSLLRKIESNMTKFIDFYNFEAITISCKRQLIHSIDQIFIESVIKSFKQKLSSTSREELSQIYINLEYFHIATLEMSSKLIKTLRLNKNFQLKSCAMMSALRDSIEDKLINLIDSKVQDLMEMIDIDWTSSSVSNEPNLIIADIAQFLEMMFTSTLINLPSQIRTLLIFREFDIVTNRFLDIFINMTPKTITPQAVLNFETDIHCLENVVSSLFNGSIFKEDDDSSKESLKSTFDEINQYIKLIKTGNLDENFNTTRMKIYPRIQPELAVRLMNKLSTYQNMIKEREMERQRKVQLSKEDGSDNKSLYATQSKKLFGLGGSKDSSDQIHDDSRSLLSTKTKKKFAKVFQRKGL
ncbi:hypothetical protein QEN19_001115 [Hanseniaspora menglaensis]